MNKDMWVYNTYYWNRVPSDKLNSTYTFETDGSSIGSLSVSTDITSILLDKGFYGTIYYDCCITFENEPQLVFNPSIDISISKSQDIYYINSYNFCFGNDPPIFGEGVPSGFFTSCDVSIETNSNSIILNQSFSLMSGEAFRIQSSPAQDYDDSYGVGKLQKRHGKVVKVGDVNCDGYVNCLDYVLLSYCLSDWGYPYFYYEIPSDIDNDGTVKANDRLILGRYVNIKNISSGSISVRALIYNK